MDRRAFLAASAALPFAPAAWARLGGGTPLALVTADLESHVVAVDAARGRVVRHIATEPGPRSIETIGGATAVVAHTTGGAVSLLDATRVHAVVRGFTAPRYTAADARGATRTSPTRATATWPCSTRSAARSSRGSRSAGRRGT